MATALACSCIHTVCSCCSVTYLTIAFRGADEERIANTDVAEGKYPLPVLHFGSCLISLQRTKRWLYAVARY
jgi:hypothetical protein